MYNKLKIIKYLRLSLDDDTDGESESIKSQREIIDNYILTFFNKEDYEEILELSDDGYSGTNFNRPGIKEALNLLNSGEYNCIIVKDLSRFGRDHIEVGNYLEHIFPALEVRVISVNDGYDSKNHIGTTVGVDMVLKNLVYEMYSMDISRKIKSAKYTMMVNGNFKPSYTVYGYKKEGSNIIIDEFAAGVVKRIFDYALKGMTTNEIAKILNCEGIDAPGIYKNKNKAKRSWGREDAQILWTACTVRRIIFDEKYTGTLICGKKEVTKIGDPCSSRQKPKDKWIIIENHHMPIVSQDDFDKVGKQFHRKSRISSNMDKRKSLLYCEGCGHALMIYNKNRSVFCSYSKFNGNNKCVSHVMKYNEIMAIVSDTIKALFSIMRVNAAKYTENNRTKSNLTREDIGIRIEQLKKKKFKFYEDFRNNKITQEKYISSRADLQKEIDDLTAKLENNYFAQKEENEMLHRASMVLNYPESEKYDEKFISYFVEKIVVGKNKKITIKWKFGLDEFLNHKKEKEAVK